jgi:uncharacterized membrane protein YqiK
MSGATLGWTVLLILLAAGLVALVVWLFHWLYRRSSKEISFVRTGFGGQKVVIGGGAFVLPIVHDVTPVNMSTLRLEVRRGRDAALITKNRMRVDVVAEFHVRVAPRPEAVAIAAQTLGRRSMDGAALSELVEGKFVDALRSVAAEMTMEELHEKRGEYVKRVRAATTETLSQNGLELEAVSLTGLDQTGMEFFNPSNAFDAEGLTRLTEEIERRKKTRNDIEQDTLIAIRNKNLETEKLALEIDRESEGARLAQEQSIETERAAQRARLAEERARADQESEAAQIASQLSIQRARIAQELALEQARIEREQSLQRLEVDRRQSLELAEQQRAIAVAEASRAQSDAQAAAEVSRALAVTAEEKVQTARETEVAERRKAIELIGASEAAEREGLRIKLLAAAEKAAALDRGDALRSSAEAEADGEKIRVLVARLRHEVAAEGARLMNEAENMLSPESRASTMRLRLIDKLEAIVRESVKPLEKIEGIRILQVDGMMGGGGAQAASEGGAGISDSVVNSALRYRAQAPLIDALLKEIGLSGGGGDLSKLTQAALPDHTDTRKAAE